MFPPHQYPHTNYFFFSSSLFQNAAYRREACSMQTEPVIQTMSGCVLSPTHAVKHAQITKHRAGIACGCRRIASHSHVAPARPSFLRVRASCWPKGECCGVYMWCMDVSVCVCVCVCKAHRWISPSNSGPPAGDETMRCLSHKPSSAANYHSQGEKLPIFDAISPGYEEGGVFETVNRSSSASQGAFLVEVSRAYHLGG
jgi:hypothetical protein